MGSNKFSATPKEQLDVILSGVADVISKEELLLKLKKSYETKKPLIIKLGADPSAPDIHLGHTVVLQKMRQFQSFGHEVVFLIGDFTGLVGDPTGKKKTRPPLTETEVKNNAETYKAQIGKILDLGLTRIVFNSEWLSTMNFKDVLKLTSQYTVARILERDDFTNRFKNQIPITIVEFLYPLMQGYDSVALHADVEIGGMDQRFNLIVGRELQKSYGQSPQAVVIMPILEGLDGIEKMSKSLKNYVGINEEPGEIYGKLMSIPDTLMIKYFELLSDFNPKEISELRTKVLSEPKTVKMLLARSIVEKYYDSESARVAERAFEKLFGKSGDGLPEQIEEVTLSAGSQGLMLTHIMTQTHLAESGSAARRLINQGGVKVDQIKEVNSNRLFQSGTSFVLQCGKRHFRRVFVSPQ